jgi:hypothetical protein
MGVKITHPPYHKSTTEATL